MPGKFVHIVKPSPMPHWCDTPYVRRDVLYWDLPYVGGTIWECECGQRWELKSRRGDFYWSEVAVPRKKLINKFRSFIDRVK